ncbi:MAG: 2-phosphosulfolactate phosphatase [Bacteroidales bacterium]
MNSLEVCYSPALFDYHKNKDAIVVVVDVLRATSSICTAFANGVEYIIPVKSKEEALSYKEKGFVIAAERNGLILDFADIGNSPYNFSAEVIGGKKVVYSTTNGTKTIQTAAAESKKVVIGAFSNISVLTDWLIAQESPIIILCAGWKNRYNIEDTVFAGALSSRLLSTKLFTSICDSTTAAIDMWHTHKHDLRSLIDTCAQRERLRVNKLDDCIDYCISTDTCPVIPEFDGTALYDALLGSSIPGF